MIAKSDWKDTGLIVGQIKILFSNIIILSGVPIIDIKHIFLLHKN